MAVNDTQVIHAVEPQADNIEGLGGRLNRHAHHRDFPVVRPPVDASASTKPTTGICTIGWRASPVRTRMASRKRPSGASRSITTATRGGAARAVASLKLALNTLPVAPTGPSVAGSRITRRTLLATLCPRL